MLALALVAVLAIAPAAAADTNGVTGKTYDEIVPAEDPLPQTPIVDTTPQVVDLTFPVAAPHDTVSFIDDFLALRGGGSRLHAATDVMAPKHRPIHAAVGGTITWAPYDPDRENWSALGEPPYGWMISIRGDDGHRYSYVHLNNDTPERTIGADGEPGGWLDDDAGGIEHAYAPRIVEAIRERGSASGLRVERGELIGWNGDSGNAKGVPPHLHLEIEVTGPDGPYRINPYHSLQAALEQGRTIDSGGSDGTGSGDGNSDGSDGTGSGSDGTDSGSDGTDSGDGTGSGDGNSDGTGDLGWTFVDVDPDGTHGPAIEALVAAGVLEACTADRYCPEEALARADLATALARALELPTPADPRPRFPDVDADDPRAGAVVAVDGIGVLSGYTDGTYGPDDPLSRAQLASVLVRAFEIPPALRSAGFDDVDPAGAHTAAIDALAQAGLTRGCADGTIFCGGQDERRDRIATFIQRGLSYGAR